MNHCQECGIRHTPRDHPMSMSAAEQIKSDERKPRPIGHLSPLAILSAICAYLVDRAADVLPDTYATDPNGAANAYGAFRAFQSGTMTQGEYLADHNVAEDWKARDEWPVLPMTDESEQGAMLDGSAISIAPDVFTSTVSHPRRDDGTVRTYRKHLKVVTGDHYPTRPGWYATAFEAHRANRVPITDEHGQITSYADEIRGYGHDITRRADMWLRANGSADLIMVGSTQDEQHPYAVTYRPSVVEMNPQAKGNAWLLIDGEPATIGQLPSAADTGLGASAVRGHKATATMGRHRTVSYSKRVPTIAAELSMVPDMQGNMVAAQVVQLRTNLSGYGHIIGQGTWIATTSHCKLDPTVKQARAANRKQRTVESMLTVEAEHAPDLAAGYARQLTSPESIRARFAPNAPAPQSALQTETDHETSENPRAETKKRATFSFVTTSGHRFTVALADARRYRLTHVRPDGSRSMTTATTPSHISAQVLNRLR